MPEKGLGWAAMLTARECLVVLIVWNSLTVHLGLASNSLCSLVSLSSDLTSRPGAGITGTCHDHGTPSEKSSWGWEALTGLSRWAESWEVRTKWN